MTAAIVGENLTRRFGNVIAVEDVSLEIAPGEIFGLIGPDGAGKTTTLRMLAGLVEPSQGRRWIAGLDVAQDPDRVRDRLGYMAQRFGLYGDLTVAENMRFYADLFGVERERREQLAAELLRMTRMEPFTERRAARLSGGMKQKLALMCTLLHRPEVLLLDEPTNGVDPVSRRDFWDILRRLSGEGIAILTTTAYLDEAERCGRVALMNRGRIIQCGTPAALRNSLPEECYAIRGESLRPVRERLAAIPAVLGVEPAGRELHVFTRGGPPEVPGYVVEKIEPSLEDVFIAHIRRAERR
jgi:ABC-2 type transport system ATP-binding protein